MNIQNEIIKLSPDLLLKFSDFVARNMGLYFPKEKLTDLERRINSAKKEFNFDDTEECINFLISSPLTKAQIEILASHLTIGETYFFRDKKYFEVLESNILPKLIESRRRKEKRIRIWCAGCCTGEEPYSIAILLHKLIHDLKDWNITISATDINPIFLKKASTGVYTEWSFRDTPNWVRENYFTKLEHKQFRILNTVNKMVTFSYLNLADNNYPSLSSNTNAMDIIFCRNVLMYFLPELANRTALRLGNSLVEDGWLLVSPAESSYLPKSKLQPIEHCGIILYKKNSKTRNDKNYFSEEATHELAEEISSDSTAATEFNFQHIKETYAESETVKDLPDKVKTETVLQIEAGTYNTAFKFYNAGNFEEAEKMLVKNLPTDKIDSKEAALLARINANKGKLNDAFNWCSRAIEADKLNASYYYLQGTILQELGNRKEAIRLLKQTLYLDHNFVMAYLTLSNLISHEGKAEEAKRYTRNAKSILSKFSPDEILDESEGITAGRLLSIIQASNNYGNLNET